jgi:hypothetical protein
VIEDLVAFRGADMDGAVILGAGLIPEYVTEVLREEEPFRHVASSMASREGRGRDFDGGVKNRLPGKYVKKREYVDITPNVVPNLLKTHDVLQRKCFLQLF